MARPLAFALLAGAALAAPPLASIPATDERISWTGRRVARAEDGAMLLDWEGTALTFTVSDATFVGLNVTDGSLGGSRLAVYLTGTGVPNLRVATLVTSPHQQLYTLGSSAPVAGATFTYRVVLLTEPQFIKDGPNNPFAVAAVVTDGSLEAPPPKPARRIEFIGDSLTAGYGAGFDLPTPSTTCGGGVLQDDVTNDYSGLLCDQFGAECTWEAWSGITIVAGSPSLPDRYPYMLGGWGKDGPAYNFSTFVPQAIVINLGENDCNANLCKDPTGLAKITAAFVKFVPYLSDGYRAADPSAELTFFLAIAPHEKGQSAAILPAVTQLTAAGYSVQFLNATIPASPSVPDGCGGHPGPTIHKLAAARAYPVIAAAMGWN